MVIFTPGEGSGLGCNWGLDKVENEGQEKDPLSVSNTLAVEDKILKVKITSCM